MLFYIPGGAGFLPSTVPNNLLANVQHSLEKNTNRYYWHKQGSFQIGGGGLRRELPEFYYEISDKFTISDTEQNSNKHKRPENNETRTKHKNCSKCSSN